MRLTYTLFLTEEQKNIKTFDLLFLCLKNFSGRVTYTRLTDTLFLTEEQKNRI